MLKKFASKPYWVVKGFILAYSLDDGEKGSQVLILKISKSTYLSLFYEKQFFIFGWLIFSFFMHKRSWRMKAYKWWVYHFKNSHGIWIYSSMYTYIHRIVAFLIIYHSFRRQRRNLGIRETFYSYCAGYFYTEVISNELNKLCFVHTSCVIIFSSVTKKIVSSYQWLFILSPYEIYKLSLFFICVQSLRYTATTTLLLVYYYCIAVYL